MLIIELWLAAILFVSAAAGLIAMAVLARRKSKKKWMIAGIISLSVILLALLVYILLTFVFLDALSSQPPDDLSEAFATAEEATANDDTLPADLLEEVNANHSALPEPSSALSSVHTSAPDAMPDDFDLPVSEVPVFYPDVLGLRDEKYGDMPVFNTVNEASAYVLHNVLNKQFEMEFYLVRELVPDEGSGYILFCAFENAQSYFPFGAYDIWDAYTEDRGDPDKVFARLKVDYTGDEKADLEARTEAVEFVMKNPVPYDGFADYESEKAYALKIHDFIARKITYSPIGYNINAALSKDSYKMKQEAYNVLGEDQQEAVCAGYARAFAMICHYAGIRAAWVRGNETEDESHAWNVIYPRDGSEPVIVDVTWDDCNSDDTVGQTVVSDWYFYLPVNDDYEHIPVDYIEEFLVIYTQ